MDQESNRRRLYENCNVSEADLVKLDHRFCKIEDDVKDLETRQKTSEEMLREIHEKICKTNNIITGFKLGAFSVIGVIVIAGTVFTGFFTGKISLTEIIKILMS